MVRPSETATLTVPDEPHQHSIAGPFTCPLCADARRKALLGECRGNVDRLIALIWDARHGQRVVVPC